MNAVEHRDTAQHKTYLTLHKTYYNQGFFNIRVDVDRYVRQDEGRVKLVLGNAGEIDALVNRRANQNGTARVLCGVALSNWFKRNYRMGAKIPMRFVTPNRIILG